MNELEHGSFMSGVKNWRNENVPWGNKSSNNPILLLEITHGAMINMND